MRMVWGEAAGHYSVMDASDRLPWLTIGIVDPAAL
jgi:hypothetical protein